MKKILALLLALVMVFSLAACSDEEEKNTKENANPQENKKEEVIQTGESTHRDGFMTSAQAAKAYVLANSACDAEALLDTLPDFMWDSFAKEFELGEGYTKEALTKALDQSFDKEKAQKVTIRQASLSEDYSEEDLEEALEAIATDFHVSEEEMAAISKAEIILVEYEGDEEGGSTYSLELFCAKIDGSWYVIRK